MVRGFFTHGKDYTVYVATRILWFLVCSGTARLAAVTGQCPNTFTHPCVRHELRICLAALTLGWSAAFLQCSLCPLPLKFYRQGLIWVMLFQKEIMLYHMYQQPAWLLPQQQNGETFYEFRDRAKESRDYFDIVMQSAQHVLNIAAKLY